MKLSPTVYVILFIWIFDGASGRCLDGWWYYNDSCYLFGHHNLDFIGAETFCHHYHAKLVEIETERENIFLKSVLNDLKGVSHWIGLVDEVIEGEWRWHSDDRIANYTDWYPNQPDEGKSANCANIRQDYRLEWLDTPCTEKYKPLCEKPFNGDVNVVIG